MTRLLLALLQRSARNTGAARDLRSGTHSAVYPTASRAVARLFLVIGVAIAVVLGMIKEARQEPRVLVAMAFFLVLTTCLVIEFTGVRVEWTDAEIGFTSPWASSRRLRWNDIVQVKYAAAARWFIVRGRDGTKIRLSYLLGGLGDLLEEMKRRTSDQVRGQLELAMRTEFPEQREP